MQDFRKHISIKFILSWIVLCALHSCKAKIITIEKNVPTTQIIEKVVTIHDTIFVERDVYTKSNGSSDIWSPMINASDGLKTGWTSMVLYDLGADTVIYNRYGSKNHTPASNIKLLTMYAALKILPDSVPGIRYIENDTSLIFWGCGDPSFLNQNFSTYRIISFLQDKAMQKKLYYYPKKIDGYYGGGWMWDDYAGNYQPELCPLPMYENMIKFSFNKEERMRFTPSIYPFDIVPDKDYNVDRDLDSNYYHVTTGILELSNFEQQIPIYHMADQVPALLSQSIGYTVKLYPFTVDNTKAKTLYSMPKEPIIRQMMEESDNFIAEHLLLGCGSVLRDSLSTTYVIDTLLSGLMSHLQPRPKWVDGSGLSRYNLMTPDMIIALLRDMYKGFGESKIFSMLGHGGGKGTLKRFYNDQASPYVYAKTGTLSGVFCLSGYMIVRSGRRIAFSVMNNHFDNSASKARTDVQRLLKQVYLTY